MSIVKELTIASTIGDYRLVIEHDNDAESPQKYSDVEYVVLGTLAEKIDTYPNTATSIDEIEVKRGELEKTGAVVIDLYENNQGLSTDPKGASKIGIAYMTKDTIERNRRRACVNSGCPSLKVTRDGVREEIMDDVEDLARWLRGETYMYYLYQIAERDDEQDLIVHTSCGHRAIEDAIYCAEDFIAGISKREKIS